MEAVGTRNKEELPPAYMAVVGLLKEGKEEALTSSDIVRLTNVGSKREIFEIIEQLIVNYGYVIGATRSGNFKGYYLISNAAELQESLHSYNNQIQSMMKRHKKLRENYLKTKNLNEMEL